MRKTDNIGMERKKTNKKREKRGKEGKEKVTS